MAISELQRLISSSSTVFIGDERDQAAFNAANNVGNHPDTISRVTEWPALKKFDNDTFDQPVSPFGSTPNPDYIWVNPTSDGQTASFAAATGPIEGLGTFSFSVYLVVFADNAMEAKIELFQKTDDTYEKVTPQPPELGDFQLIAGSPHTPAVGLTESPPYSWQDIRVFSTRFTQFIGTINSFKIDVSFEATNHLIAPEKASIPSSLNNPAGLQFMVDIYRDVDFS